MKILFQGGWQENRDPIHTEQMIAKYCRSLAKYLVSSGHQLILTSPRLYENLIADEITSLAKSKGHNPKEYITYLISDRFQNIPPEGKVINIEKTRWWQEERTYFIKYVDALITIGGGKGTSDCIQKALLSNKPAFVACMIPSISTDTWKKHCPNDFNYLKKGDAEFLYDLNVTPDEFFAEVFRILNSLGENRYSRRIFIVHGRNYQVRDNLVSILKKLNFEPVVLQNEPNQGLTIIEKLERDLVNIGFGFVIYTPDELGHLPGEVEKFRARQNVILEHGLLIGLIGRERTCALIQGDIEMPSDFHGIIYERFNNLEEEAIKIVRILKQSGYSMDLSSLI
jgi:predicted nucleotide-binding protein